MENREKEIQKVTLWGAVTNTILAVLKLMAGIFGHSAAMAADAVHSFSDLVSDAVVLAMVRVSSKGEDKSHDYGHGKFETLATLIIALLLIVVGAKLMAEGVERILQVARGASLQTPGLIALWAALVSIAVKEYLYQWTARTGRKHNSTAVVANAWHHRTDALSSVASALGIGAAVVFGGKWIILDPLICCAISVFIFVMAVKMAIPALTELTEASLPDDVESNIEKIVREVEGVDNVHALKTRKNGPNIIIDAHVVVNPAMSVAVAHEIMTVAETALRSKYGQQTQISLHVEPDIEAD